MTKQTEKTENRLSTLEANYENLSEKITEITDNHLLHLSEDIKEVKKSVDAINSRLAIWSGAIMVVIFIIDKIWK